MHTYYVDNVNMTNNVFAAGAVTISFGDGSGGGVCASTARYTQSVGGGVAVEQFSTYNLAGSTCADSFCLDQVLPIRAPT